MTDEPLIYTRTMAKIYADQGHLKKAMDVYRYLAEQSPGQQDLKDALAEMKERLADSDPFDDAEVVRLFHDWIDAMRACNRIRRLRRLQKKMALPHCQDMVGKIVNGQ